MNELEVLKTFAQEHFGPDQSAAIGREELATMLGARSAAIKARILSRLGSEIRTYLLVLAIPILMLFARHGISTGAIVGSLAFAVLLSIPILALSYKDYQIRSLALDTTLTEALTALIATVDSTTRLYMAAYLISVAGPVAVGVAFLVYRWGLGPESLAGVLTGIAVVAWCYLSGRAYLERAFGAYRQELAACLCELKSF